MYKYINMDYSKLETVLENEVNKRKRRREETEKRQTEEFRSIIDVVKTLAVIDVLEHIEYVTDEFFNLEATRYIHEIKKIKLNKVNEDCAHHLGVCACNTETKKILEGTNAVESH